MRKIFTRCSCRVPTDDRQQLVALWQRVDQGCEAGVIFQPVEGLNQQRSVAGLSVCKRVGR